MENIKETAALPACPVETTLMLIGDKWKVLILRDLLPGTKRFGELKKSVGNVSQNGAWNKPFAYTGFHEKLGRGL